MKLPEADLWLRALRSVRGSINPEKGPGGLITSCYRPEKISFYLPDYLQNPVFPDDGLRNL